mmetsp:Transcript_18114/g.44705  ORF Transcript_18114/g.44705 Transcript_18114/m.44705 type:complete len:299 (+) Transcript_18114:74-970(+)
MRNSAVECHREQVKRWKPSPPQKAFLESFFYNVCNMPDRSVVDVLAATLEVERRHVRIWFQNRRQRDRKRLPPAGQSADEHQTDLTSLQPPIFRTPPETPSLAAPMAEVPPALAGAHPGMLALQQPLLCSGFPSMALPDSHSPYVGMATLLASPYGMSELALPPSSYLHLGARAASWAAAPLHGTPPASTAPVDGGGCETAHAAVAHHIALGNTDEDEYAQDGDVKCPFSESSQPSHTRTVPDDAEAESGKRPSKDSSVSNVIVEDETNGAQLAALSASLDEVLVDDVYTILVSAGIL